MQQPYATALPTGAASFAGGATTTVIPSVPVQPLLPAAQRMQTTLGVQQRLERPPIVREHLQPSETIEVQPIVERQREVPEVQLTTSTYIAYHY